MASENAKSDRLNVHSFRRILVQNLAGVDFWVSARLPLPFVSDAEPNLDSNIVVVAAAVVVTVIAVTRVDIARARGQRR